MSKSRHWAARIRIRPGINNNTHSPYAVGFSTAAELLSRKIYENNGSVTFISALARHVGGMNTTVMLACGASRFRN
jgi:hypothetical protein